MATKLSASLAKAIQDGTFPESEELLRFDTASSIPHFLESLRTSHAELDVSVNDISNEIAGSVDSWIAQAEKIQKDITRCKEEAKQIVQDHNKISSLQAARHDAQGKVDLLQEEVAFNETLREQLALINEAFQDLNLLDDHIRGGAWVSATRMISRLKASIKSISSDQSQSLLSQLESQLSKGLQEKLESELATRCHIQTAGQTITIRLSDSHVTASGPVTNTRPGLEADTVSSDTILTCLEELDAAEEAYDKITKNLQNSLLPHIRRRSKSKPAASTQTDGEVVVQITHADSDAVTICSILTTTIRYFSQFGPRKLSARLISSLATQVVPLLVVDWLDPAVPLGLESIKGIETLIVEVRALAAELKQSNLDQSSDLEAWINQLPRTWASRRRMRSLDTVRQAFQKSTGTTQQVERVEKQTVVVAPTKSNSKPTDDDWAENWDDVEEKPTTSTGADSFAEDDSDAWGFDTAEDDKSDKAVEHKDSEGQDDVGEAWGWDDDDDGTVKEATEHRKAIQQTASNGVKDGDVVLTEHYAVTDIPDYILDQISRDVADLEAIQASPTSYFQSSNSTTLGISPQSLPTSVLAMFRATAPLHYQTSSLSSMNLYNDTLYLTDKLDILATSMPTLKVSLEKDISTLAKFARTTYTTELTLQRTILYDLLDSAQGFVSCTRPPYAQVCEDAISSVTDYLRSLHHQWQPILSLSHLRQAIGSLLSGIMAKIITDIEDMEDISEPESQKLVSFCERITALQDLFPADISTHIPSTNLNRNTDDHQSDHEPEPETASQIALYVPAYLRFAYFQQILGGSLADIRYFWEEGGLSLEFTADEIVDLIEALFAQSVHRKNAIKAIRG